ncbi:MAG: DUF2235 domain-containing protein [Geminicoccaceae bacterium]
MSKNIVVLSDGTWNDGAESETNIHWLNEYLVEEPGRQVVFYDKGVGADWFNERTGGALGVGLSRNVRQLYAKVLDAYEPGDDIYCFGFSRGAFTVRSLCGFMNLVGRVGSESEIDEAYTYYRIHEPNEADNVLERFFKPTTKGPIAIRFLGVFDTVGSLGLPFEIDDDATALRGSFLQNARNAFLGWLDGLGDRLRRPIKGFHDTNLGGNVEEAYHALAIDERRRLFPPTMWTGAPGTALKLGSNGDSQRVAQRIEQTWFAGVHSDVGGGYVDMPRPIRISNLPLLWMAEKAEAAGLVFKPGFLDELWDWAGVLATAPQHDSLTQTWNRLHRITGNPELIRPIGNRARQRDNPEHDQFPLVDTLEWIDGSVARRLERNVEIRHGDEPDQPRRAIYNPPNVVRSMIQEATEDPMVA